MARIESPSSINTYRLCKRKYYYSYKLSLPKKENISAITGKIVHETLENFFKINAADLNDSNYGDFLKHELLALFNVIWVKSMPSLSKLENSKETIREHYEESMFMLHNFIDDFLSALSAEINGSTVSEAFGKLKPKTEVYLRSDKYNVQGFVDAVLEIGSDIYIVDYKTGSRDDITEEYKLQLAIYALLYREKYEKLPKKVGLHFLRHGTKKFIEVSEELLQKAKKECELIHINTESNSIEDYDKSPGPYCRWKTGQCSFYDICYGVRKLEDFGREEKLAQLKDD